MQNIWADDQVSPGTSCAVPPSADGVCMLGVQQLAHHDWDLEWANHWCSQGDQFLNNKVISTAVD